MNYLRREISMNNEFSKPYEYEDEKRGLLVLFISMILSVDSIQTIFLATQNDKYIGDIPFLKVILYILVGLFLLFIIYTSISVYRMKSNFVTVAKRYIIIRTILLLIGSLIVFLNRIKYEDLVGKHPGQYLTKGSMLYIELFMPLFFILVFSLAWYLYFTCSKRCRKQI